MKGADTVVTSKVEAWYLAQSGRELCYRPTEKICVIEAPHFPELGRMTALRFLEWVQQNPEGVVSLPTGKTPEFFIKFTQHYLKNWDTESIQEELARIGLDGQKKPQLNGLHFVQIDEFYPLHPSRHNSFYYYVNKFYLHGFGLNPDKALLIDSSTIGLPEGLCLDEVFPEGTVDLSLRSRDPESRQEELQRTVILAVDQFCTEYEARIRDMGGIGFFLGGIGPDGHIGFNVRGSHHFSPTRLTLTNYETEAAAAVDLGGIEVSRNKPVITTGLATLTFKRDAVVIIFVAGEAKSRVVAEAIERDPSVLYPATALHQLPNARFYLTSGAGIRLIERRIEDVLEAESIPEEQLQRVVIDRALSLKKRLEDLGDSEVGDDRLLKQVLQRTGKRLRDVAQWTRDELVKNIGRGLDDKTDTVILHTGPHPDDIMLGYMPYVMHLVRNATNKNYFYNLTSGFTAVTNSFMGELLKDLESCLEKDTFLKDIRKVSGGSNHRQDRAVEVYRYLDGIAARDEECVRFAQARRTLFNLMQLYEDEDMSNIKDRINENLNYLKTVYPGKKDVPIIQKLKGMQREYEEELTWAYVGTNPEDVFHGRLEFYTGDIFTPQPTYMQDVAPVLDRLHQLTPDVVTLAFDPEGTGPDTHYKVLQTLHEALLQYQKEAKKTLTVWGYRNVWHRFHPADANVFFPVSLNTMAVMAHSFMNCLSSQRNASFPTHEYDGPFCYRTQALWVNQFKMLQTCLGERYFVDNSHPRLRATRGFVFLKEMALDAFSGKARSLAKSMEGFQV